MCEPTMCDHMEMCGEMDHSQIYTGTSLDYTELMECGSGKAHVEYETDTSIAVRALYCTMNGAMQPSMPKP